MQWRVRGDQVIYPGMEKLAAWGECSERHARTHMRFLGDEWKAVRRVKYAQGGRRATRYQLSGEMLFRGLVARGCNPSPELREGLSKYDLKPASPAGNKNPEVGSKKKLSEQALSAVYGTRPDQSQLVPRNPEENPEVTSAGSYKDTTTAPGPNVLRFPASPGRSADASLLRSPSQECKEVDAHPPFLTVRDRDAFRRFLKAFPRRHSVDLVREAFRAAIEAGVDPETIIAAAERYAGATANVDPEWIAAPTTWLRVERWTDEPDFSDPISTPGASLSGNRKDPA